MIGFLNIYKPKGITSHDVVSYLRKITKIKQIGHTGTLDPFAEGVLPICIGKATRLIEYLADDKAYITTVKLGQNTDTYDLDGKITEAFEKTVKVEDVENALKSFEGEILQMPPIYSAIKVNGKKLYDYARKGEDVKIEPRKVTIEKIVLKCFDEQAQTAEIFVKCSKGTYIRSIAYDLGKILGTGGHLIKLVRTQAGKFFEEEAAPLYDLKTIEQVSDNLINPLKMLDLPKIDVSTEEHEKILHGQFLTYRHSELLSNAKKDDFYADFVILIYNDSISAIGYRDSDRILIKKVFDTL